MRPALGFRPRLDRVDELLVVAAHERNPNVGDIERALGEPALTLTEIFPDPGGLPGHYGGLARSLWRLVDEVFKAADWPSDCPPGFKAKSVQVADIFEQPPAVTSRTAFLVLWYDQAEPVLVPCPELPSVLTEPTDGTLAHTREELHAVVWEIAERLNVIAPAARALGDRHERTAERLQP